MYIRFCSSLILLALQGTTAPTDPSVADNTLGMRAYWVLVGAINWPKDVPNVAEQRAIDTIETAPEDVVAHLTHVLSKDGLPERNASIILGLFPVDVRLRIARTAITTFPVGQVPVTHRGLLQLLGALGQEQDMTRIKAEMETDPDRWGRSYALAIAATRNPAGLKMLRALRGELKGEWQNDPIVKAALEEGAPTSRPTTQPGRPGASG